MKDFAVFILTHGRPDNVITYRTLQKQGYTGDIYIIIDNEDEAAGKYKQIYGDKVIQFDKAAIAKTFDECDNFDIGRKAIVYARNACFDIARDLGITYFLQLDDDYKEFQFRFDEDFYFHCHFPKSLDKLFGLVLDYYKSIPALTIAFAQTGDMIGGNDGTYTKSLSLKRKAMNTFFCSINRPFQFVGRLNEDVVMYTTLGSRGNLIFTIFNADIVQKETQQQSGGMTDIYLNSGTYVKTFYAVMNAPSCVKVSTLRSLGDKVPRIHHQIDWPHAIPVILDERYRKVEARRIDG